MINDYDIFLDKKEVTGTFQMNLKSSTAQELFGVQTIPWHIRWRKLFLYLLFGNHKWAFYRRGYAYPDAFTWNMRHLPIKRNLKLTVGDIQYDQEDMYLKRIQVSRSMGTEPVITVDFSSGA